MKTCCAKLGLILLALAVVTGLRAASSCDSAPYLVLGKQVIYRQSLARGLETIRGSRGEPGPGFTFSINFDAPDGFDFFYDGLIRAPDEEDYEMYRGFWSSGRFASAAALDAAHPNGTYYVEQETDDRLYAANIPLRSLWPNPPVVQNLAAAQEVEAGAAFTVQLDAFNTAAPYRLTAIVILDTNALFRFVNGVPVIGNPLVYLYPTCGQLPQTTQPTALTIPAGVLDPGKIYNVTVSRIAGETTAARFGPYRTDIQFVAKTEFTIQTLAAPQRPVITAVSGDQRVNAGGTVTFSASGEGRPAPTWQWRKNGRAIPGATSSALTIPNCTLADAGRYSVEARNSGGAEVSRDLLLEVVPVPMPPRFVQGPTNRTVLAGRPAVFSALAIGEPAPSYQWFKDGVLLLGQAQPVLNIRAVTATNTGFYQVAAMNSLGSATSAGAVLSVVERVRIVSHPVKLRLEALSTLQYPAATFSVAVAGTGPYSYQWRKGGRPLPGADGPTLTIPNPAAAAAGAYSVVVSNAWGRPAVSRPALLVLAPIPAAPSFIRPPGPRRVTAPGPLQISAVATGARPFMYQWYRALDSAGPGYQPIVGATNATFRRLHTTTNDSGFYCLVVSNLRRFADGPVITAVTSAPVRVDVLLKLSPTQAGN